MRYPHVFLSGLLLGAALPGRAQTTETPPTRRFYVGLGAYSSLYQSVGYQALSSQSRTGFRVPMQFTAGYQLRPRLAVQVGLVYTNNTYNYDYAGRIYAYCCQTASTKGRYGVAASNS